MPKTIGRTIIPSPIDATWAVIRDFTSTPKWFPPTVSCHIDQNEPADRVGVVKLVGMPAGIIVHERLTGLSDVDHVLTYRIEEITDLGSVKSSFGTDARIEMRAMTHGGGTFVERSHYFEIAEGDPQAMIDFYNGLYGTFFEGLTRAAAEIERQR